MYRIQTMNKISPVGLNRFPAELYEVGDTVHVRFVDTGDPTVIVDDFDNETMHYDDPAQQEE